MENIIYSDFNFCDQYVIFSNEIPQYNFFINSNLEIIIQDNHGNFYKKISEKTSNWQDIISNYIGNIILCDLIKFGIIINENNVLIPFLNNQIYEIILYEKGIYLWSNLVLKNKNNDQWIYLDINCKKYSFYNGIINGLQIIKTNDILYEIQF